jgi:exodeoxyribonuclease V alpha subunit
MTDVVVDSIVSSRDFGTIFAGRLGDGSLVRVKAAGAAMLGVPSVGELWSVDGELRHTRFGPQISATRAVRALPSGELMIAYLSGCVAGIGPARGRRLWDRFENLLPEVLDAGDVAMIAEVMDPERPVLGPRLAGALVEAWKAMAGESRLVEWLAAVGITDLGLTRRVHRLLGADAVRFLQTNPYCLVPLLDWKRVDALGLRLFAEAGHADPSTHPHRLTGAADGVMKDLIGTGSTAVTPDIFRISLGRKLGVAREAPSLDRAAALAMEQHAALCSTGGLLRAPGCAVMEDAIVDRLRRMAAEPPPVGLRALQVAPADQDDRLSPDQAGAIHRALSARFACLNGGAGVGKTHVTRSVCDAWEAAGGDILLAALAGKAALRLSRSTGRLARTIFRTLRELDEHRTIEDNLAAGGLDVAEAREAETRLKVLAGITPDTLVILDEASMVDLPSLFGLLRRMPDGASLLLVGDERQLPPVGFGLLFHRFVRDPAVTATLTTVHRQAAGSSIPAIAALLRRRQMPDLPLHGVGAGTEGVTLLPAAGREAIADHVVSVRETFGAGADVMVVTPVNDTACGVAGLNRRLHDRYLASRTLQELRGPLGDLFSPGEPVMHLTNDYKRALFNGSLGTVRRIDRAERGLIAVFDGEEHVFGPEDLINLALGYAMTCHRAQGSEADHVIVALPESRLLDPSWLYTAITRARRSVVIVGQPKTVGDALARPFADEQRTVGLLWP